MITYTTYIRELNSFVETVPDEIPTALNQYVQLSSEQLGKIEDCFRTLYQLFQQLKDVQQKTSVTKLRYFLCLQLKRREFEAVETKEHLAFRHPHIFNGLEENQKSTLFLKVKSCFLQLSRFLQHVAPAMRIKVVDFSLDWTKKFAGKRSPLQMISFIASKHPEITELQSLNPSFFVKICCWENLAIKLLEFPKNLRQKALDLLDRYYIKPTEARVYFDILQKLLHTPSKDWQSKFNLIDDCVKSLNKHLRGNILILNLYPPSCLTLKTRRNLLLRSVKFPLLLRRR